MPQPNPIKQSTIPGQAIGDWSDLTPGPPPGATVVTAVANALPWQAHTVYLTNQLVTDAGQTYIANREHTSSSTFGADQSVYWTAVGGAGGGAVTQLIAGTGITLSPSDGLGNVTINATAAVSWPWGLTINAYDYVTPDGGSADQSAGWQAAFTAAANNVLFVPAGTTRCDTPPTLPSCSSLLVYGLGGQSGPPYLANGAQIVCDTDVATAPFVTKLIDFAPVELAGIVGICVSMNRQIHGGGQYGCIKASMCGIGIEGRSLIRDLATDGFGAGIVYEGSYDHADIDRHYSTDSIGVLFAANTLTEGDQYILNINYQCSIAAFAMYNSSSGFNGDTVMGGGLAPVAMLRCDDGSSNAGGNIGSCFLRMSTEFAVNGAVVDLLPLNGAYAGQFTNNIMVDMPYSAPQTVATVSGGYGWTFPVVSNTSTTVTIRFPTDGTAGSGFWNQPGLIAAPKSGGSAPANTHIARGGVPSTWWTASITAGTLTLTLDQTITGTPTSIDIYAPNDATFHINNSGNTLLGELPPAAGTSRIPGAPLWAGQYSHDNSATDIQTALALAALGPLSNAPDTYGNVYGNAGGGAQVLDAVSNGAITINDIVMSVSGSGEVTPADGSRPAIGNALNATTVSDQNLCVQLGATNQYRVTVNNKTTAATISAGNTLYVDVAHAGGVTNVQPLSGAYTQPIGNALTGCAPGGTCVMDALRV